MVGTSFAHAYLTLATLHVVVGDWKIVRGDHSFPMQSGLKTLVDDLAFVGSVRLRDWGPRDPPGVGCIK